ncbi:MAG: phospholipase D family protein [Thermoplasmataceae archaeon]
MVAEPRIVEIKSAKGFSDLFNGYLNLKAVTYVADSRYVMDFFNKLNYENLEIIIGENFSDMKDKLNVAHTEKLLEYIQNEKLKIYVPPVRVHTKLYILEKGKDFRVIIGSRNLQESKSQDLVLVFDLQENDGLLANFNRVYNQYVLISKPLFDDLLDFLASGDSENRNQIISYWLEGLTPGKEDSENPMVQIMSAVASGNEQEIVTISVPKTQKQKTKLKTFLGESLLGEEDDKILVKRKDLVNIISKEVPYPKMFLKQDFSEISLFVGNEIWVRSKVLPPERSTVRRGIESIEKYIEACEISRDSSNEEELAMQKTGMYEVILYLFSSPFFHELMKLRMEKFGLLERRGPRFLIVYGQSFNGKTTLLRYCMKLLTGKNLEPLGIKDFKTGVINTIKNTGTVFPLIFDDIKSISDSKFEELVKTYWEKEWSKNNPVPQLIFSTNRPIRKDWAKTRTKFITLPVYFRPSSEKKAELNMILGEENDVFPWFSNLFLSKLGNGNMIPGDDDLQIAREVFLDLYNYAGKDIPTYFPTIPFEEKFDAGRYEWRRLLTYLGKAEKVTSESGIRINFKDEMENDEVMSYEGLLPEQIRKERKGKTIIIHSAAEFDRWIGDTDLPREKKSFLRRIFHN